MSETQTGIGKDPEQVDAEAASDEQVLAWMDDAQATVEEQAEQQAPSRHELHQIILDQQARMDAMAERIEDLEQQVDDVSYEADTMQEVAEQFRQGEIGGEAGADFLREFVSIPDADTLVNARAAKLFFTIITERRVGKPVRSKDVVAWLNLKESANPSVQAKRIMERLERHRADGYFIGDVETGKWRGQNCIWLNRQ